MDPSSSSNITEFFTRHLHLEWTSVDFVEKSISGHVQLTVQRKSTSRTLLLDTRDLKINAVQLKFLDNFEDLTFKLLPATNEAQKATFGEALEITLPELVDDTFQVKIDYSTTPQSTAIQWLTKEQTYTNQHPYLFTQCQAIHARSLVPCQDSPGVKSTYSASITVPKPLQALMSAVLESSLETATHKLLKFTQTIPIPSYLIALAIGALEGIEIGPRSTVWSEKGMVEKAAKEFKDTESFIKTAEDILTPYEWGRYDLLVLPPSFPYGGMFNRM